MFRLVDGPFANHVASGKDDTQKGDEVLMGPFAYEEGTGEEQLCVAVYIVRGDSKAEFSHIEAISKPAE